MKIFVILKQDCCEPDELEIAFSNTEDAQKYIDDFYKVSRKFSSMRFVEVELVV